MSQRSPSHIRATAIRALATATLRRLTLSVLFTIATNSYQTTCTVSERTFNKRQHANARQGVDLITLTHYDSAHILSDMAAQFQLSSSVLYWLKFKGLICNSHTTFIPVFRTRNISSGFLIRSHSCTHCSPVDLPNQNLERCIEMLRTITIVT